MKERPILFSTSMVQGIRADSKTETRRTTNLKEINENPDDWNLTYKEDGSIFWGTDEGNEAIFLNEEKVRFIKNPYGQPGDVLWVRESFAPFGKDYVFKSNPLARDLDIKWKPSIHMPKAVARIWLMVESVSLERLEDITDDGAIAEGVMTNAQGFHDYEAVLPFFPLARDSFYSLWRSINGKESSQANPWVWVVKYRVLTKTGDLDLYDIYAQSFDIQRIERKKK
jgi:hypothetical protein